MRKDERVNASVNSANSLGYRVFWYGGFAVLLYRWFVLEATLLETIDMFAVWVIASVVQFVSLALKGVPMTYPVSTTKKEKGYYLFITPLAAGVLSVLILVFVRDVTEVRRLLGGFLLSGLGTFVMLSIYAIIATYWERKNT